jgi:O-antigen biosynthesis protein
MVIDHAMTLMTPGPTLVAIRGHARQLAVISQSGGLREVRQRFARSAYEVSGARELEFPVPIGDIANPDLMQCTVPSRDPERGRSLTVGWATTPPTPGSGGHTTNLRMVRDSSLCPRHQSRVDFHAHVIRERNSEP